MRRAAATALLMLAACSGDGTDEQAAAGPPDLETAAIERGLIRDPGDGDISGLYTRDTDRVCIVRGPGGYRIGAFVDYGEGLSCAGRGVATLVGNRLAIEFSAGNGSTCAFDAGFDGERITFPAALPETCARLCAQRASFAALDVERVSGLRDEAATLRTANGKKLCGD
ncbi:hypothetical protein [Sphingomonas turrisvirgatae]|uniref:Uncharacterized protein n=1 Tax=Sphingomonas turrisvirgatae TaxID=1888892 RepID=A0A1E3LZV1_9SPHN|nr:hypothetical protein [Sphingomonas turrisvirgatae]ODP39346.1 hypothetical protein BFL28_11090 [Sphingomonas turrisvirgatae]